jgi:hypothetical protein
MIEAYLVTPIANAKRLNYLKTKILIISTTLVMVAQHQILLAGQTGSDIEVEIEESLIAAKEKISQVNYCGVLWYHSFPSVQHHSFVVERTTTILHDVLVVEMRIRDNVKR